MSQASTIEERLAHVERDVSELKSGFSRLGGKEKWAKGIAESPIDEPEAQKTATWTDIGSLITQTPDICGGRPRITGTGVSVRRIVGWYKLGMTPEEIAAEIPHLELAQVHAALSYYHANRVELETAIAAEEAEADRLEHEHREGNLVP
jgi:uncharacterized protein (DUF433 family)